ncbi:MAG: biotin/lipoyl-binding protein [Helicobacteraceae bacterium]|nr:biotin/lipoyl-binding protein [Helicobacteraceae bacterium]
MKKIVLLIIIIAIGTLIAWVGDTFYKAYQPKPLKFQGQIDATTYSVSSEIAGRIESVYVKKGDMVKEGDLIFSLHTPLQSSLSKNEWLKSKVALTLMKKTYVRLNNLFESGVIAKQKKDIAYTEYKAAQYNEDMAKKAYEITKNSGQVNKKINEVVQYARNAGEVSSVLLHSGEVTPVGLPIVSITDINDSWARFFIREDILYKFPKGKEFKMKIPALNNKEYIFVVDYIAVMGDFATWKATEAGKNFDMKSFEIHFKPKEKITNLRVGMSLLLQIDE